MQIVAYGQQDAYLTGRPQISFWKVSYRRYTNFAIESIEQTFNGQADFGRRVVCVIARNGDLAYRTYLQVTLPEIGQDLGLPDGTGKTGPVYARWLDYIGEHMISQVELEVGGMRIDRQYGDWMHIWNQLTGTAEHYERGYAAMVGNTTQLTYLIEPDFEDVDGPCNTDNVPTQVCAPRNALPETTLYIPLTFWFCRNPGLALPLIALQYHEVRINVDLRPIDECLWAMDKIGAPSGTGAAKKISRAYSQSLVAASLYVDYVFLDTEERRKMAQNPHEYLIEQLQFTGDESIGSSSNKIKLNANHPCKELIFVVQPDANVDYCKSFESGEALCNLLGAQPFNYTDALDVLPNSIRAYGAASLSKAGEFIDDSSNLFVDAGAFGFSSGDLNYTGDSGNSANLPNHDPTTSGVSDAGVFVLAETGLNLHCWGQNPVVTAKLQMNGQDRFSEREGTYFDLVQPWQCHTRTPDTGINVYSFALRPEEHQPCGTCNFSRVDNATLQLIVSNATVSGNNTAKVRTYLPNYNVFRVMSGMGGVAYSA